jgi:GTP cyclohydrolase I
MQVQEINRSNKNCIQEALDPLGVAVVEAQHMCMQMRGIQKQNSVTTTSSLLVHLKETKLEKNLSV